MAIMADTELWTYMKFAPQCFFVVSQELDNPWNLCDNYGVRCKTSWFGRRWHMAEKKAMDAVLRPKRQLTLPRGMCEQLGIGPGDVLELSLKGDTLIARPKKKVALEALREIRQAFERSGITEKELQEAGRRARQEVTSERYSARA